MQQILFLLLPTLTFAYIQVDLIGTVRDGEVLTSNAYPRGSDEHVITEKERVLFGIQNEAVKAAIEKINGKKPDEVYITSSTPFGDLHTKYGWKQVHVKIQPPQNKYDIDFGSKTVKLSKTIYGNPDSRPTDTFINENGNISNTIHSYWINAIQFKESAVTVRFNFKIEDDLAYFKKTLPFGRNTQEHTAISRCEKNYTYRLEPGEKVTAELEALKGTFIVEIPYELSLSGHVVAKYNEKYKDKYFFKFEINDILKGNNITTTLQMKQCLIYEVLYNTQVYVRNSKNAVLRISPAEGKVNTKGLKKATNKHEDKVLGEGVKMTKKKLEFNIPTNVEVFEEDNDEESEETIEK